MSQNKVIEDALLLWTKGVAQMFDPASLDGDADAGPTELAGVQSNASLLCSLQTVLMQDGDEDFEDVYQEQQAAGRSATECLLAVIETLEVKYGRSFGEALRPVEVADDEMTLSVAQMRKVVELTLGWAMLFGQDEQKQKYIEHIFTLAADHQQALMLIIQEQQEMAYAPTPESSPAADNGTSAAASPCGDVKAEKTSVTAAAFDSPFASASNRRISASAFTQNDSPYKRLVATNSAKKKPRSNGSKNNTEGPNTPGVSNALENLRAQLRMVKEENIRLHSSVAEAQQKLEEREQERAQISEGSEKRAAELKKIMRAEMEAIERESELRTKVEELTQRNSQLREQAKELSSLREENRKLRDDSDVLSSVRSRLDKSEHVVSKLKERLVNHDDVVEELRRVQEINAKQLAKIDQLSNENVRLPGLEQQVASYQRKLTDTKVEMSLAVAKNREMQKEIDALLANQSGLESGLQAAMESNCNLATQTSLAEEADMEIGVGATYASLGSAVSEVNPEVRERLATLERENKIMKEKLGKTDLDALDALEERCCDAEQLRDAFEGKYVTCTKEIKTLQGNVKDLTEELTRERKGRADDLMNWEAERKELCTRHETALSNAADRHARALEAEQNNFSAAQEAHAAAIEKIRAEMAAQESAFQQERARLESEHEEQMELAATDHQTMVEQMRVETESLQQEHKEATDAAAEAARDMEEKHRAETAVAAATHDEAIAAVQEEMANLERHHAEAIKQFEAKMAALQEDFEAKEAALNKNLSETQEQKSTIAAEFSDFRAATEAADQRAKVEMVKMQSDTKKLYQSYTKVNEKSKQRAAQVEQLTDEVKALKKKNTRLERERGVQESRLRMKQQSEELDELKAVVEDYKRTLKNAQDVRKNVAHANAGLQDDYTPPDMSVSNVDASVTGGGDSDSLVVARKRIDELSSKHRQLLFNNVELTMKKAEVARTLDSVMREKATADEEITRLRVHVARIERAAKKAGVEVHPLRKADGTRPAGDLDTSFSSVRSNSSRRSTRSTRSHRTHHRTSSAKKPRGSLSTLTNSDRKPPRSSKTSKTEEFRSAADVFGDEPSSLPSDGTGETLRRFTMGGDENALRKARLMQMREKLKRDKEGTKSGRSSGTSTIATAGGIGNRLRRAARLAANDENVSN